MNVALYARVSTDGQDLNCSSQPCGPMRPIVVG